MKKIYTLILAALTSVAAMAQANHPAVIKGMPRINEATAELPALRHAAPQKAGGQVLPINKTDPVKLYTNEAYSWEGHYDYYFSFANSDDEFFFPMIFFDLYLPTADGLQEGTYKMSEGTVDENLMVMANFNDYVYYMYGYLAYEWADATITLTKGEGDNVWTVDFSVTTIEDFTFSFNYTGEFPVEEDDFDPNDQEEPEVQYTYDYEPDTAEKYDLVFQAPDCSDSFVDEYKLYDIYLDHTDVLDDGRFFEGHLYLVTNEHQPHADLYPVNSSGALNTFLASEGCPEGSSKDTPCFFRTADDLYVYDSWYIMAGQIALGYDADGKVMLQGDVATYKGSEFHFTTANYTDGINTVLADGQTPSSTKWIRDGKVYINGGHFLYNTAGQRVK